MILMSSKRKDIKTELVCGIYYMCANASIDGLNSYEYWGELKTFSLQIISIHCHSINSKLKTKPSHLFEYKEHSGK